MCKKFPKKARNRYDLLNFDLDLQSIFYSKSIINKIKKIFNNVNQNFSDFKNNFFNKIKFQKSNTKKNNCF